MQIYLVGLGFVLEGSPDFRDRGNHEDTHGWAIENVSVGREFILEYQKR